MQNALTFFKNALMFFYFAKAFPYFVVPQNDTSCNGSLHLK